MPTVMQSKMIFLKKNLEEYPSRNWLVLPRTGVPALLDLQKHSLSDKCRNPLPWDKLYTHKLPQKKADEPEPEEETDDMPQSGQLDLFGLGDDEEVSE